MKRIEKVKLYVQDIGITDGVTASQIAEDLHILRCDASSDLNKLCHEGVLEKHNTRPVRFFLKGSPIHDTPVLKSPSPIPPIKMQLSGNDGCQTDENDIFSSLSKYNPSLRYALHLVKAAVSYPPHGLNVLITGETGVGKNFLAEAIWRYATDNQLFEKGTSIPFVSFSCAEYADNPQLLLSQLFGYVKGAFSGASESKPGLLEKANGGIFFLDEIHRLPATGQEILFTLIDNGTIRRLGDTMDRHVQVMLLCATTEDTNTTLLKTFLRRIPVSVHIPSLSERTINEKLYFIHYFLQQESHRINMPVHVSGQVLKSLLAYEPKGNIGELKNILNLCCAKAYLGYLSSLQSHQDTLGLTINLIDLPQKVYNSKNTAVQDTESIKYGFIKKGLHISPGDSSLNVLSDSTSDKDALNLYGFIEKRMNAYRYLQMAYSEIEERTANDLELYYENITQRLNSTCSEEHAIINAIIPPLCKNVALEILHSAEEHFNCTYPDGLVLAFALHIQQFMTRYANEEIVYNPNLENIKKVHYLEMEFLKSMQPDISKRLGIPIPEDELGFWAMFLTQKNMPRKAAARIGLIVVAHGANTATSMADLANDLMNGKYAYSLDVPISQNVEDMFHELEKLIKKVDNEKGVLLLADMGSLSCCEDKLVSATGINCKVIPNVSSALVLEAVKTIISTDESLETIYGKIYYDYYQFFANSFKHDFLSNVPRIEETSLIENSRAIIITLCSTGYGGATKIKEILEQALADYKGLQIVAMSICDDINSFVNVARNKLKLIIGGFDLCIPNVPHLDVDTVFHSEGLNQIRRLLDSSSDTTLSGQESLFEEKDLFELLTKECSNFTPSIPTETAIAACMQFCWKAKDFLSPAKTTDSYYLNLAIHFLCMLERLATQLSDETPEWGNSIINRNHPLYLKLKEILREICEPLGYSVPKSELCYFLQIL